MKTTGKVIIAIILIAALIIFIKPGLLGSNGTPPTFNIGTTPTYDIQSNITCTSITPCNNYLSSNLAPNTITAKCVDEKCLFTTPNNPDSVQGGGLQ